VVTSAAEAETHGVFHNAKTGLPIQHLLQSMGHPQKPFLIKTDNSTSAGYVNNNMQMKKSKTWDMYLHWLRNKENKNYSRYGGIKVQIMTLTILQNTILLPITENCDQNLFVIYYLKLPMQY